MPQETAATWPVSGTVFITFIFTRCRNARHSATQAPVIAAQRVPPSAFSTSQSSVMVTSPIADAVHDGAQRAADQALDFLRAAGLFAARGLAVAAGVGGARQHAVFGGDPAQAGVAQERRHAGFHGGGAQHLGAAHADQAGAFGVVGEAGGERDLAQRVGGAAGWAHAGFLSMCKRHETYRSDGSPANRPFAGHRYGSQAAQPSRTG